MDAGGRLVALRTHRHGGAVGAPYDPVAGRWRELPADPLPKHPRSEYGGVLVGAWAADRLYVATGEGEAPEDADRLSVAAFDPATRRWQRLGTIPAARNMSAVDSRIVIGGAGAYDPAKRRFRPLPKGLRGPTVTDYALDVRHPAADGLVAGDRITIGGRLLDPATLRSLRLPTPPEPGTREPASAGAPGLLFRFGGSPDGVHPSAETYLLRLWAPPATPGPRAGRQDPRQPPAR